MMVQTFRGDMKKIPVLAVVWLILGIAGSAHAYLDPGSGSMVVQALLAGVAGLLVALKFLWHRISAFLKKDSKNQETI
jgi:hypothetical protein